MTMIKCNSFVLRQTASSPFSYYAGSSDDLVALVERGFDRARPGYKTGVMLVTVPPQGFYSGIVKLAPESVLVPMFAARRDGEVPFIDVRARGAKLPALAVDVVIYDHATLGADASTDAEWEIVSINARCTVDPEPMTPVAMMRNMLGLAGGTPAEYTARELAESIRFWSMHAMCAGEES